MLEKDHIIWADSCAWGHLSSLSGSNISLRYSALLQKETCKLESEGGLSNISAVAGFPEVLWNSLKFVYCCCFLRLDHVLNFIIWFPVCFFLFFSLGNGAKNQSLLPHFIVSLLIISALIHLPNHTQMNQKESINAASLLSFLLLLFCSLATSLERKMKSLLYVLVTTSMVFLDH